MDAQVRTGLPVAREPEPPLFERVGVVEDQQQMRIDDAGAAEGERLAMGARLRSAGGPAGLLDVVDVEAGPVERVEGVVGVPALEADVGLRENRGSSWR